MTFAQDRQSMEPGSSPAREAINEMLEVGLLDSVMYRVDAGRIALTDEGGLLRR